MWLVCCQCRSISRHHLLTPNDIGKWNLPDSNHSTQEILECLSPLHWWQCLGDSRHIRRIFLRLGLQSLELSLEVLPHMSPHHVGSSQISASGLVVAHQITRHCQSHLRLGTKHKWWGWNGLTCIVRISNPATGPSQVISHTLKTILVKLSQILHCHNPLVLQLDSGLMRNSHLIHILKERRGLPSRQHHGERNLLTRKRLVNAAITARYGS